MFVRGSFGTFARGLNCALRACILVNFGVAVLLARKEKVHDVGWHCCLREREVVAAEHYSHVNEKGGERFGLLHVPFPGDLTLEQLHPALINVLLSRIGPPTVGWHGDRPAARVQHRQAALFLVFVLKGRRKRKRKT